MFESTVARSVTIQSAHLIDVLQFSQAPRRAREELWERSSFAWPLSLRIALPRRSLPFNLRFFTFISYFYLVQCIFIASKCLYSVLRVMFLVFI